MHDEKIAKFSTLRDALASAGVTALEVIELMLARLADREDLHAVRHVRPDAVRREAEQADLAIRRAGARAWRARPLLGMPVTVKELTAVAGLPYSRGRDGPAEPAERDAPAVRRLRAAGALVLGTTSSPADGWCGASLNGSRPATRNPRDREVTAGGSSAGAAAAVAAGIGLGAIGTDGAGSVRIPASFCGVVGFKPTFGLVPYVPVSSEGLSHIGALASEVEDAAELVQVMSGADPADPASRTAPAFGPRPALAGPGSGPLRVAWAPTLGAAAPGPEVLAPCRAALARLSAAGHSVEPVEPPAPDGYPALATILAAAEARTAAPRDDRRLHPVHRELVRWGRSLTAADLASAIESRALLAVAYDRLLDDFDVLVTPTVPVLPFGADAVAPAGFLARGATAWLEWTPNTYTFNLSGQPAVTIPVGQAGAGLPVGLQVAAARGHDRRALRLAAEVHRAAVAAAPAPAPAPAPRRSAGGARHG
jgi:aspartyl-tRNA(Asn)/glutamyl-tRNA(Gln) amidotransferase subunit A